jgi:hypothetical protein
MDSPLKSWTSGADYASSTVLPEMRRLVGLGCEEMRVSPFHVITGLVPVIPIRGALFLIGMAGTDPRIKSGDGHDGEGVIPERQTEGEGK